MTLKFKHVYCFTLIISILLQAGCASQLSRRHDVRVFATSMEKKYQFNRDELLALFKQVQIQKNILVTIQHPYEEQPWYIYQNHLVSQQRIRDGKKYWKQHARVLQYAQNKYGIPASIIVAIIGVESNYGKINFKYRTIDALATLGFYYPKRSVFFKQELEQYLLFTRQYHLNPLAIYGSYAGALGPAQFMPSTYRRFAINYKTANTVDIINNHDDAIVSVANFLKQKGWQSKKIIAVQTKVSGEKYKQLLPHPPRLTVAQFKPYGIIPPKIIANRTRALLVPLQTQKSMEYWLGFNNFMVLMKYNPNINYAMAIYHLTKRINQSQT